MSRSLSVPLEHPPRPRLKDGLVALWRDESTIQVGLDAERAAVVGDVSPESVAALRLLDGRHSRDEIDSLGTAARALIRLLDERGLLGTDSPPPGAELDEDARRRCAPEIAASSLRHSGPDIGTRIFRARRSRRILVRGAGRVGTGVAHLLAASGAGRLDIEDETRVGPEDVCPGCVSGADLGLRRDAAATALAVRALPPSLGVGRPDLALLCVEGPLPPPPESWAELVEGGAAVLPVVIRESTAIVGPMVLADRLDLSGCPYCPDRHRADRDPSWPELVSQLRSVGVPGPTPATLVWATAALAAGQALALLDHLSGLGPSSIPSIGATLELAADQWTWRRRWWGPHPGCSCLRRAVA